MNKYELKIKIWMLLDRYMPFRLHVRLDRLKRLYFYRKTGVIFIHIPKSAGSSVCQTLYGRRLGHHKAVDLLCEMPLSFDKNFTFAIVRNPFARVFSAYQFAKKGGGSHGAVAQNPEYSGERFDSFECFVTSWLINVDLGKQDGIFQPQYTFVYDRDRLLVDYIGKVEALSDSLAYVSSVVGLELVNKKINVTRESQPFDFDHLYTETMRKIVVSVYKKDFELFDYCESGRC